VAGLGGLLIEALDEEQGDPESVVLGCDVPVLRRFERRAVEAGCACFWWSAEWRSTTVSSLALAHAILASISDRSKSVHVEEPSGTAAATTATGDFVLTNENDKVARQSASGAILRTDRPAAKSIPSWWGFGCLVTRS